MSMSRNLDEHPATSASAGSFGEIFRVFLRLGLTSFGGPVAHLGYFRQEFVVRRRWIDEGGYADLIALCHFLPGPASSQLGFTLGVRRGGGLLGGLAAWLGFTLPSALILVAFALWAGTMHGRTMEGLLHGLKLVAVAVVAQAVWGMARNLAPDRTRAGIALAALTFAVIDGGTTAQIGAIVIGAIAGLILCGGDAPPMASSLRFPVSRRSATRALALFGVLLMLPIVTGPVPSASLALFNAFYRAGALVFGGGHVVLPLLQAQVVSPGWVSNQDFLAGYGVAQAVPGPLFTFAAYLGAVIAPGGQPIMGALIALIGLFLPGMLLVYGMLPFWDSLRTRPSAQAAMRGTNAAVVGILGAALYNPVWTSAVLSPRDFVCATGGFLLLTVWKVAPWIVVLLLAILGACFATL